VVPPIIAAGVVWIVWRHAKRHDAAEAEERRQRESQDS
jgi:cbb3-type cytochrome oxidase subunit 3